MKKQYDVFISYRRDGGAQTAKHLRDILDSKGYRVFYDIDSLKTGWFNTELLNVIEHCKDFIIILSPGALERCENADDWVRQELACALRTKRNVIPILADGFTFPKSLPADIDEIRWRSGIQGSVAFFDAVVDRLISFMKAKPLKIIFKRCVMCAALVLLIAIIIFINRQPKIKPSPVQESVDTETGIAQNKTEAGDPEPETYDMEEKGEPASQNEPVSQNEPASETLSDENLEAKGECGDFASWMLYKDGLLKIEGKGALNDYPVTDGKSSAPWKSLLPMVKKVSLEDGIYTIGEGFFYGMENLTEASLPDSVAKLGMLSFSGTALKTLVLPAGLEEIDELSFYGMTSLKGFEIPDSNESFAVSDGVLFNHDMTKLIAYPAAKEDVSYEVPKTVTGLSKGAFALNQSLSSVILPEGIKEIPELAFKGAKGIGDLNLPYSVQSVGKEALSDLYYNTVIFHGKAPKFDDSSFLDSEFWVYFPKEYEWPGEVLGDYGGKAGWIEEDGADNCEGTRGTDGNDYFLALDGDESTIWRTSLSDNKMGACVSWMIDENITPTKLKLKTGPGISSFPSENPSMFYFYGRRDNDPWVLLLSVKGAEIGAEDNMTYEFPFETEEGGIGEYNRFYLRIMSSAGSDFVQIAEAQAE